MTAKPFLVTGSPGQVGQLRSWGCKSTVYIEFVDKAVGPCALAPGPSFPPIPVTGGNPQLAVCICWCVLCPTRCFAECFLYIASSSGQLPDEPGAIVTCTLKVTNLRLAEMEHKPQSVRHLIRLSSSKYLLTSFLWMHIVCLHVIMSLTSIFLGASCGLHTELGAGCSSEDRTRSHPQAQPCGADGRPSDPTRTLAHTHGSFPDAESHEGDIQGGWGVMAGPASARAVDREEVRPGEGASQVSKGRGPGPAGRGRGLSRLPSPPPSRESQRRPLPVSGRRVTGPDLGH